MAAAHPVCGISGKRCAAATRLGDASWCPAAVVKAALGVVQAGAASRKVWVWVVGGELVRGGVVDEPLVE